MEGKTMMYTLVTVENGKTTTREYKTSKGLYNALKRAIKGGADVIITSDIYNTVRIYNPRTGLMVDAK